MLLSENSSPTFEPVSLTDLKAHLRLTHEREDSLLALYLKNARQTIENSYGLSLAIRNWTAYADSWHIAHPLNLPIRPVTAITSIQVIDTQNNLLATFAATDFQLTQSRIYPQIIFNKIPVAAQEEARLKLVFSAGFAATKEEIPGDIQHAILLLTSHWFENRGDTQSNQMSAIPQNIASLLTPYQKAKL